MNIRQERDDQRKVDNTAGQLTAQTQKPIKKAEKSTVYIARTAVFIVMTSFLFFIILLFLHLNLNINTVSVIHDAPASQSPASEKEVPVFSVDPADAPADEKVYAYDFSADIREYEEYMDPSDRDAYMMLVNYDHVLSPAYMPSDLTEIPTRSGREIQKMRYTAAMALTALLKEAEANGITDISVTSGWRSYNTQVWLLENQVEKYEKTMSEEEAYALAVTEVAIPGTSEHQSGLAVDMHNLEYADQSFSESESAGWLTENCFKFGFILRYPSDKTEITRISFEPWHFRFVGRYHASRMQELGFCLEEYTEYIS